VPQPDSFPAPPRALTAPLDGGPSPTLALALLLAICLHLALILGVSFEMPLNRPEGIPDQALEILILKGGGVPTELPSPDAVLSQRSSAGESSGGDGSVTTLPEVADLPEADTEPPPLAETEPEAAPPGPAPQPPEEPPIESPPEPPPEPPPDPTETAETPAPEPPPAIAPPPEVLTAPAPDLDPLLAPPPKVTDAGQILSSRNQEIARLTASLEARTSAYARRVRRKSVSASTREFRYASYLAAWARKVEGIGNLNYPQAAKDQRIYGNLILHVALRADGSVEQIRVVRSSGYDLLDQAAVRIVELGAPYSPFPPDIAAETDVLDIIRTWQFLRGGKLGWEQ
jgi:protein TonB